MDKPKVAFCQYCGNKLVRLYPGGDPESGPSRLACKDESHGAPSDDAYSIAINITDALLASDKFTISSKSLSSDEVFDAVLLTVLHG